MSKEHVKAIEESGSLSHAKRTSPKWVELNAKEVEKIIVDLNNHGTSESEIGMILRDMHGVPSVKALTGKRIGEILEEKGMASDIPRDLLNLIRTSVKLQKHMEKNKKDNVSKRGYQLTVSKIRKLARYYTETGKLEQGWKYTPEGAALLVK
ncbi:MAG TPA: 30S ribosomal protein S15 [archaeon]|nr:30S ribosomal protein S15 [archaeon]